ncbi:response regulator [Bradyrhizobium paxllaeri]|uniref:response regulator n=1 Tax=Bradyrhizobium paxllaeri TaxID=190148 RepID=UPI0008105BAA|nr:response regulator [Bradyrhizobium paxllaeri]
MTLPSVALVVEDDELQRELLSDFLKEERMDVISCESAEAAELIIASAGPELSLLVTDFRLAGNGTGADVASFAKDRFPHLPVIIVSGDNNFSIPVGVRFLKKPFSPSESLPWTLQETSSAALALTPLLIGADEPGREILHPVA